MPGGVGTEEGEKDVKELVASIKKHKNFKVLAAYSVKTLASESGMPPQRGRLAVHWGRTSEPYLGFLNILQCMFP